MICKPYKLANIGHVSQDFSDRHKAVDFAFRRGSLLVAPEHCWVEKIITAETVDENLNELSRGYGIVLKSAFNNSQHLYWHCHPVFPVKENDMIRQGQIVAQMSNSGFVKSDGKIVPIKDRLKFPYKGVHVHWEMLVNGEPVDPLKHIDWDIPVANSIRDKLLAIKMILLKILELLKR